MVTLLSFIGTGISPTRERSGMPLLSQVESTMNPGSLDTLTFASTPWRRAISRSMRSRSLRSASFSTSSWCMRSCSFRFSPSTFSKWVRLRIRDRLAASRFAIRRRVARSSFSLAVSGTPRLRFGFEFDALLFFSHLKFRRWGRLSIAFFEVCRCDCLLLRRLRLRLFLKGLFVLDSFQVDAWFWSGLLFAMGDIVMF